MRPILFLILVVEASALIAGDAREKPADYPAQAESARLAIGAEYLVHSAGNGLKMFFVPGYLVIDAGVYPRGALLMDPRQFALRINGKMLLPPEAPQAVGYSLTFSPDGLPQVQHSPGPPDPEHPDPQYVQKTETPSEALVRLALQQGEYRGAQGGYLYFAFNGRVKKIQSLDLLYTGDGGPLAVKLF
jgi:hypothetical protein